MRRVDDTFFIHRWIRRPGYSLSRAITSSDDMTSAYSAPSMANVSSCTVEASSGFHLALLQVRRLWHLTGG